MIVNLLTECLSLKGGCRGSSESTLVKMPRCWKSHSLAQISYEMTLNVSFGCLNLAEDIMC